MAFVRVRRVAMSGDATCPLCRGRLGKAKAITLAVCRDCDAVHHRACVEELAEGLCATMGCGRRLAAAQVPAAEEERAGSEERTLVVRSFAADMAALWATGLIIFVGLMVVVFGIAELRWPAWILPAGCTLPLVLWIARGAVLSPGARDASKGRKRADEK